jgi:hypothetical protein
MQVRKVIEIQAETYFEEQSILNKFPDSVWIPSVRGLFATFYIPETKAKIIDKFLEEQKKKGQFNGSN